MLASHLHAVLLLERQEQPLAARVLSSISGVVAAPCPAAGIAAIETLKLLGATPSCGVGLKLHKGLPLGSGMGSSAASAAAAAWAVNSLFGCPLPKDRLIYAGLASEAAVSGYHADNIAPAIMGGFILVRCVHAWWGRGGCQVGNRVWHGGGSRRAASPIGCVPSRGAHGAAPPVMPGPHACVACASPHPSPRPYNIHRPQRPPPSRSCDPLDLQRLPFAGDLWFVLVNPRFEAPTAEMRAVLPKEIPMKQVRARAGRGADAAAEPP
jgi:hypothetical protein